MTFTTASSRILSQERVRQPSRVDESKNEALFGECKSRRSPNDKKKVIRLLSMLPCFGLQLEGLGIASMWLGDGALALIGRPEIYFRCARN